MDDTTAVATTDPGTAPGFDGTETSPRLATLRKQGVIALIQTSDQVRRFFGAMLEPYDLTTQQYNVLRILRGARPDPLPTMEIAERMIEQAPGITRLLDRLDAKGLVNRVRCASDRRQVLCSISDKGLALLAELDAPMDAADRHALQRLDDAEVTSLVRLLEQVRQGLA